LQHSTRTNDYQLFKKYSKLIDDQTQKVLTLRGLMKLRKGNPVPVEEAKPLQSIFKRFATGAMSFGSISWEAHTTMAGGMNSIGITYNTREGGDDEFRYINKENGDDQSSAIKQVATVRFGVTSRYWAIAKELQNKIAQGAEPGEGRRLP